MRTKVSLLYQANAKLDPNHVSFGQDHEQGEALDSGDGTIEVYRWADMSTFFANVQNEGRV